MIRKKSHALILLSWLHDFLIFEGIYVLATGARNVRGREASLLLAQGFLMMVPVILTYVIIRRCKNIGLFLLLAAVLTWMMATLSGNMLTGCLTAFVCLFRCYVRMKEGELRKKMREMPGGAGVQDTTETWEVPALLDSPRPVHCVLFVLMYLGLLYFHSYRLLALLLGILAAELCVCLAYCYLEPFSEFIMKNRHVANLPVNAMKKIRAGILGIGLAALVLCMLPAAVYHKEPLAKIRIEFDRTELGGAEFYEETSGPDYMMEALMRLNASAKETPVWLKMFSEAVGVVTLAGVSFLALKLVVMAVRRAMEVFSDGREDEDEFIFLGKEKEDGKKGHRLEKRQRKERWSSPDRKIRRLYKKAVRRGTKGNIYGNETPKELEERAGNGIENVHELYEKARYGKEECTREEAKKCVEILSSILPR